MSSTSLELGEVVAAEIRDSSGAITSFSHDYPIDPSSLVRIPSLSSVAAVGMTLMQLRDAIADAMVREGLFSIVTVNLTLSSARVDFDSPIRAGDIIYVRILGLDGGIDPSSGSYMVDGAGSINFPFLGGVMVDGALLFEAEHQIEQGLIDGGFFTQPFVNVTRVQLA
ncbi:MAG: polysaccharide biosynthesis/export family protein [Inquilinus limosus]|uniref:Polysaccharide biosynthesis/export family protein n=1 Tax=Inquilinus limosus TaxID=171674 RepID=A0A952KGT3_9PROT|nr:polysaccharide biosynthesis/export family protein [Inquilinus limosus]